MIFIAPLFLLANLWTMVPAVASSGGLLRGGSSRDSTRELDDPDSPRADGADGTDVHHQAGHMRANGIEQRIIGGIKAPSRRHLYTVALMDDRGLFCGGVLISRDVVLTAAHCADGRTSVVIFAGNSHLPDGHFVHNGEFAFPRRGWIHPKFEWATMENDFAVYLLDEPVSAHIEVITVNDDSRDPSRAEQLVVLGWGDTTQDPSFRGSDDLMKVGVDYIPNNECMERSGYVGNNYITYKYQIADNMLCALDTGRDACQGDSGGPLIVEGSDSSGREDVLVGLTSWGVACAHETLPGVYARVSVGYKWIKSIVCGNSVDPPESFNCSGGVNGNNWDEGDSRGKGGNNEQGDNSGKEDNGGKGGNKGQSDAPLMGGNNGEGDNSGKGGKNGKVDNAGKGNSNGKSDAPFMGGNNGKGDNSDKGGYNGKGVNGGKGGNKWKGGNADKGGNNGKGNSTVKDKKKKKRKNKKKEKKPNKKKGQTKQQP